jgi:hypothetical protein
MPSREAVPKIVKTRFDEIVGLIDSVCRAHLTEEYAMVARELASALGRKRPSPLLRGHSRTWACGITYTIGSVNFLFDPAQQPHVRGNDLCALFEVSQSAGAANRGRSCGSSTSCRSILGGRFRADSPTIRWSG